MSSAWSWCGLCLSRDDQTYAKICCRENPTISKLRHQSSLHYIISITNYFEAWYKWDSWRSLVTLSRYHQHLRSSTYFGVRYITYSSISRNAQQARARVLAADLIHDIMGRVVQQVDTEAPGFRRLTTRIQTKSLTSAFNSPSKT